MFLYLPYIGAVLMLKATFWSLIYIVDRVFDVFQLVILAFVNDLDSYVIPEGILAVYLPKGIASVIILSKKIVFLLGRRYSLRAGGE